MFKISKIKSRFVLDSRGLPTVQVMTVVNKDGLDYYGVSSVPSGASTGTYEALELRDGGKPFMGKHVTKAIANVNNVIAPAIVGQSYSSINEVEAAILACDPTPNKSNLGANAILGASMSAHKAVAMRRWCCC